MRPKSFRTLFHRLVLASTPFVLGYQCGGGSDVPCDYGPRYYEFLGPGAGDGGAVDLANSDGGAMDMRGGGVDGGDTGDMGSSLTEPCLTLCVQAAEASSQSITRDEITSCEISTSGQGFCTANVTVQKCTSSSGCAAPPGCGAVYGRPLAGLRPPASSAALDPIGAYLANAAYLEAASVESFRILAAELAAHGAPPELIAAAHRAAEDEVLHARLMCELAARHGVTAPLLPSQPARPIRPLSAMALENAVDGCVHETWSALFVTWQAAHIEDSSVREVFHRIAEDETNHAELAWQVAEWANGQLDAATRYGVKLAQQQARASLRSAIQESFSADASRYLGLPDAAARTALLEGFIAAI